MDEHSDVENILKKHKYTKIGQIGEGSFGKAILVQSDDGSRLVCKMVDVSQASAKEAQDSIQEGRLMASLKHPYVVTYRESFTDNGWLCIIMDYCEGGDLSGVLDQAKKMHKPISEEQILRWMAQALLALKYIHDKRVLHRDLKSSNFFLSKTNNLKLGDFGIAKVLSCKAACARTQIGTPYYMSPEVCQEKPYSWSSDIWAMGCILYELCMLKVPFNATSVTGLVQKICRGPTPVISTSYSDFTKELCAEMLSRNPADRPSAENVLRRSRMQAVLKQMLEEAQDAKGTPAFIGGAESRDDSKTAEVVPVLPLGEVKGVYVEFAGSYKKHDPVNYHSATHREWLSAVVLNVNSEGYIVIDLKPNTWISLEQQAKVVRPGRSTPRELMPLSQRRHSIGAPVGSARARGRDILPAPFSAGNPPAREFTPNRIQEKPAGAKGYPAQSPRLSRDREPSTEQGRIRMDSGVDRVDGGCRSGSGSRASTPSRMSSPRGANDLSMFGQRHSDPPPGVPRVPGRRPRASPALQAGMAIAQAQCKTRQEMQKKLEF